MKNVQILMTIIVVILLASLSGCAWDSYETVPEKTIRVALKRPHAFFNRNPGVQIEVLEPGKRNHGNGPCAAYDFSTAIHSERIIPHVKTADNINIPVKVNIGYQIRANRALDLALNFMPQKNKLRTAKNEPAKAISSMNWVEIFKVPTNAIFTENVLPYFDSVSRDVIDGYMSKNIRPQELGEEIKAKLIARLEKQKLPRVVYQEGKGVFVHPEKTIAITDVIKITRVNIENYQNPDFIKTQINMIEKEKAEAASLQTELAQWAIRAETLRKQAEHAKTEANNMRDMLKANPHMFYLQKLRNLEDVIKNIKPGNNTEIILYPRSMKDKVRLPMATGSGQKLAGG